MPNELKPGKPRLGWFADGDPSTPHVAVMLQDTGDQIVLTVPTRGLFGKDDPYSRWGMKGVRFGDDPDRTRRTYGPPGVTMFADAHGSVVLVGCRALAGAFSFGAGEAPIVASYAVLGATHPRYERIHGMCTEMPALAAWSGLRSVHWEVRANARGRAMRVNITCEAPDTIALTRRLNLTLRPTWRTSEPDNIGSFAAHNVVQLVSSAKDARPWNEHLEMHEALRELLVLSSWQVLGYSHVAVSRADDRMAGRSRQTGDLHWRPVVSHRTQRHETSSKPPQFLFDFECIGPRGVRRWLHIRRHYARAIGPLVGMAGERRYIEDDMLQAGIALEALGYQLDLDAGGAGLTKRGQLPFPVALERILEDLAWTPLDDPMDWKERVISCYKGVKHADNEQPDSLVLANTMRESMLVLRVWLAGRLGCSEDALRSRVPQDRLSHELLLAE